MTSISIHALDTALGHPAANLAVQLDRLDDGGTWTALSRALTDADGRVRPFVIAGPLAAGTYRVTFDTKAYFEASGRRLFYPEVNVVFLVESGERYHVPLLLSPFGYSTYRGS